MKETRKISQKTILKIIRSLGFVDMGRLRSAIKQEFGSQTKIYPEKLKNILLALEEKGKIKSIGKDRYVFAGKTKTKKVEIPPKEDFLTVAKKFNLEVKFPPSVKKQVDQLSSTAINKMGEPIYKRESRRDYTHLQVITIDGADAKDLDDAIYVEKRDNHYHLQVHIADVSHYVHENTAIDKEALKRGNSVYLCDKVIPMLPTFLSNRICSLNPGEKRLTLSLEMDIDHKGEVIHYQIQPGIIVSKRRFTYTRVQEIIDTIEKNGTLNLTNTDLEEDQPFVPLLLKTKELAEILLKKRTTEGSIDFEIPEIKIYCDKNSAPYDVKKEERLFAHRIIEEFMLCANKVIAGFLVENNRGIFRTHDRPDIERLAEAFKILRKLGYNIEDKENITPSDIQSILNKAGDTDKNLFINKLILRSMKQAQYNSANIGHFGLSFTDYTHFTSPIRRYPDLMVHRMVKFILGVSLDGKKTKDKNWVKHVASLTSTTERNAMEAERAIIKLKTARYMQPFVGENFLGVITGINEFGFFVEILNTGVEGLCHLKYISGYYIFDQANFLLINKDTGKTFSIGQQVKVNLASVNIKKGFIDFNLIED